VFIMADDLGLECINSYGGTSYKTPNLTRMAEQGMQFSHGFSTPLCTPTRVQVMTGRYPFRTGWTRLIDKRAPDQQYFDPSKEITFGQMLQGAGYATAVAGKWQLSRLVDYPHHPRDCGFQTSRLWTWKILERFQPRYWNPSMWQDGQSLPTLAQDYGPDLCCDFLIDFMRQNRDKPFFAYYPMLLPHGPFFNTPGDGLRRRVGSSDQRWFGSMVKHMDGLVGRIIQSIDRLGLAERTLIVFTGDNGTKRSIQSMREGQLRLGGKGRISENGCRVPLIVRWPGTVQAGSRTEALVDLSDMMPTFAQVAGAPLPPGVTIDGQSFLPVLKGQSSGSREWVFTQLGKRRAVREHRWKFVSGGNLYDLEADPMEQRPITKATLDEASLPAWERLRGLVREMQ
jgi:arylsulfatase A